MKKISFYILKWAYSFFVKRNKDMITSRLAASNDEEYIFLRGLLSDFIDIEKSDKVYSDLVFYINGEIPNEHMTFKVISSIVDAFVMDDKLYIRSNKPGYIIGERGKLIDGINNYIKNSLGITDIVLSEDSDSSRAKLLNHFTILYNY